MPPSFTECTPVSETDFGLFPLWEGLVVLKGLAFNNFQMTKMLWSCKDRLLIIFTWGGCGSPVRTGVFYSFHIGSV